MTTADGLFEHALLTEPRPRARVLPRRRVPRPRRDRPASPRPTPQVERAGGDLPAVHPRAPRTDGGRSTTAGTPTGQLDRRRRPSSDHWGRALWALGTAAAACATRACATRALAVARLGAAARSPWPRAMAYAALGAAEVLRGRPGRPAARELLRGRARPCSGRPPGSPTAGPGRSRGSRYANAVLPEALIAIGARWTTTTRWPHGLDLLHWLLDAADPRRPPLRRRPPAAGAPATRVPGFDQQPIEVTALAEACWRALTRRPATAGWLDCRRPVRRVVPGRERRRARPVRRGDRRLRPTACTRRASTRTRGPSRPWPPCRPCSSAGSPLVPAVA